MKPFRYALFDFDGTLADSQLFWRTVYLRIFQSRGYDVKGEDFARCMFLSYSESWEYLKNKFGLTDELRPDLQEINHAVDGFYQTELTWKPGVIPYLEWLKERGIPMAVFSATDETMVRNALQRLGGLHYFDRIFSCKKIGAGKSDPASYQACLDALGLPAEDVIMFEDAPYSMKTAKEVGLQVCAVYESCMMPYLDSVLEHCDTYVMKMEDLIEK